MKSETWVVGGTALTMNAQGETIEDSAIQILDGKIAWVGRRSDAKIPAHAIQIDASKCIVCPGLINGHTHNGMSMLRGLANDLPLERWLNEAIFPMENKWVSPEFVYAGNLLAAAEMIRAGTTSFADMYFYQESAAQAAHEAGLRMFAGASIPLIGGSQDRQRVLEYFDGFIQDIKKFPLVEASIAPHACYTIEPSLWPTIVEYASKHDLLLQVHVAESREEEKQAQKRFGKSTVQYLEDFKLWSSCRVLAAHCVELSDQDVETLGKHRASVAYNAESNMKLGNGVCRVVELRKAGARVCVGTDSVVSNNNLQMLQEADFGLKLQSFKYGPGALTAYEMVRMLTIEGAAALHREKEIGSLEVGKQADLIAVDTWQLHLQPLYDPYAHLIYSATSRDVKHSIVNGKVLMHNYDLQTLQEEKVLELAFEWGAKVRSSR